MQKKKKKTKRARALQKKRVINGSNSRFFIKSNDREREREIHTFFSCRLAIHSKTESREETATYATPTIAANVYVRTIDRSFSVPLSISISITVSVSVCVCVCVSAWAERTEKSFLWEFRPSERERYAGFTLGRTLLWIWPGYTYRLNSLCGGSESWHNTNRVNLVSLKALQPPDWIWGIHILQLMM